MFTSLRDFLEEGVSEVSSPLEPDASCCICLEEYTSNFERPIRFSICGHTFGSECVRRLVGNTCPVCRAVPWEAPPDDQPSSDEDDHYYDGDDYFYDENYYYDGGDYFYDEDHYYYDGDDYYHDENGYYSDEDYEYSDEEYDEDAPNYHDDDDDDDDYGSFNNGYADGRDVEHHHYSSNSYSHHHDHNRNYDGRESSYAHALDTHDWPLRVIVRAGSMACELRYLARAVTADFYAQRVVEGMGFEEEMLQAQLASVLDQVEYYALPAINAWNEQHEGLVCEVRELRDEWMYAVIAPGRVAPFVIGLVGMLSEYMLAKWLLVMGV